MFLKLNDEYVSSKGVIKLKGLIDLYCTKSDSNSTYDYNYLFDTVLARRSIKYPHNEYQKMNTVLNELIFYLYFANSRTNL